MQTKIRKRLVNSTKYLVLCFLLLLFFLPLISMVSVSLKAESEIFVKTGKLFPEELYFENYKNAATRINYLRYVYNSAVVALMYTFTCTLSSAMAGYALARFRIRENNLFFTIVLSSIMIPYVITLIPFYLLVKNMGLTDRHLLWLIYGMGGAPFMIYLYKQFFSTIPQSYEESARIDGAKRFQIFFRIMLPLVKSGTIITAIFAFQFTWQNYIMPALFLSSLKTTLAVKINGAYVDIQQSILLGELMAGVIYYIGIPVILFFIFQKYIMRGMLEGGIKG
jgi:multiple sugar transport system permease protein